MFAILMYCIYALGQGFVISAWLHDNTADQRQSKQLLMVGLAIVAPFVTMYVAWCLLGIALDYCSTKETK